MTHFRWYRSGLLFGIKYTLECGDIVPRHSHADETLHNIVVLHGQVRLEFDTESVPLYAGEVFDFDGTKPHRIVGVAKQSMILNLCLNGIPSGYDALPESEHSGYLPKEL